MFSPSEVPFLCIPLTIISAKVLNRVFVRSMAITASMVTQTESWVEYAQQIGISVLLAVAVS
jgi:hypothetical protein